MHSGAQALPIHVDEPDTVVSALRVAGIEAMRRPPAHERIPVALRSYPGAAAWLERSVILPLGAPLDGRRLEAIVAAVERATGDARTRPRRFHVASTAGRSTVRNAP